MPVARSVDLLVSRSHVLISKSSFTVPSCPHPHRQLCSERTWLFVSGKAVREEEERGPPGGAEMCELRGGGFCCISKLYHYLRLGCLGNVVWGILLSHFAGEHALEDITLGTFTWMFSLAICCSGFSVWDFSLGTFPG